jgi:hypothetical protein
VSPTDQEQLLPLQDLRSHPELQALKAKRFTPPPNAPVPCLIPSPFQHLPCKLAAPLAARVKKLPLLPDPLIAVRKSDLLQPFVTEFREQIYAQLKKPYTGGPGWRTVTLKSLPLAAFSVIGWIQRSKSNTTKYTWKSFRNGTNGGSAEEILTPVSSLAYWPDMFLGVSHSAKACSKYPCTHRTYTRVCTPIVCTFTIENGASHGLLTYKFKTASQIETSEDLKFNEIYQRPAVQPRTKVIPKKRKLDFEMYRPKRRAARSKSNHIVFWSEESLALEKAEEMRHC